MQIDSESRGHEQEGEYRAGPRLRGRPRARGRQRMRVRARLKGRLRACETELIARLRGREGD